MRRVCVLAEWDYLRFWACRLGEGYIYTIYTIYTPRTWDLSLGVVLPGWERVYSVRPLYRGQ